MYTTILLLTTMGAGGDVVPAGGWGLGPRDHAGCAGAPATPPPCCETPRPSLMDHLRARLAARNKDCCDPCSSAAKPATPAPSPNPAAAPCGDPCTCQRVSLLDRIRARLAARKAKDCCTPCPSGGCAPASPPADGSKTPPKEMPKPKEKVAAPATDTPAIVVPLPASSPGTSPSGSPY